MEENLSAHVLQSDGNYNECFCFLTQTRKKFYDKNERFTFAYVVNFCFFLFNDGVGSVFMNFNLT